MSVVEDVKYYKPDPQYKKNAWMADSQKGYNDFLADKDGFWSKIANELEWIRPWSAVKEWNYPYAKWFVNAQLTSPPTVLTAMSKTTGAIRQH